MVDPHLTAGGRFWSAVVALPAEIDITNARRIGEELCAVLVPGLAAVVADMTLTTFCDSSGARSLVLAWERAAANNVELRLVVPSAAVVRAITLMGLDEWLPMYASLDEALKPGPAPRA